MPRAVSLLPFLLVFMGYAFAELNIWPSFHVALSSGSVFVDFSAKCNGTMKCDLSLSLVNVETNTTLQTRTLPKNQQAGRVEFDCSCFLYAGAFRFLLRQTSITTVSNARGSNTSSKENTAWWWSSELQVQWPTFHIAVERVGNHSGSFQVGISTSEHFQACSSGTDSDLFLEVSYVEYNQIGRNSIDKVRARTRHPIRPLRSQSIELSCAFPFTERDFIRVALRSPHTTQEVKSSGPLYLSRIFSYKLLVENAHAYKSGCEGTMTVKLITPPCAHISGKVLLYSDAGAGRGVAGSSAVVGFGPEEQSSPPLAFNWLTQGENETEFNCSVFYPGRNKYCFRFVFNFSRSPSPAQTCLVVYKSAESWGPWQPWSMCSVSCGEGVRERERECLLPSGVGGLQCTGMVKEQSLCSLEDCAVAPAPSPSAPPVDVGVAPLGGNMVVVAGISLCLAVIMVTIVVTVWRKFCQTPQCSSVRRGSMHSPGGRKLSDEASICGHSLQRPSLSDGHGPSVGVSVGISQTDRPPLGGQPLSQTLVIPLSQDPERLSPTGQKMLPTIFGYRLAQQQLKEMKKKGLKEATQLYHVSSSPVHDTVVETSATPTSSPIPTPTGFAHSALPLSPMDEAAQNRFHIAAPFSELPPQTSRTTPNRLSPRVDVVLGPPVSAHASVGSSRWRDRTADWVEMVERSGLAGRRGGGGGDGAVGMSYHKNPNFRRTSSFNDTKLQQQSSAQFRERSMTQVGSRTLPEGSSWTKRGWERQLYQAYPIPEHTVSEQKPRAVFSQNNGLKHIGTNTNSFSAPERATSDLSGFVEKQKTVQPVGGGRELVSGIGGPATGPPPSHGRSLLEVDRAQRAEQNWNRRGPSPIQRNMLARKLKEAQAQASSGVKGRQRSSTFSVSSMEQRRDRCRSLPMPEDYSSGAGSSYRLSKAEQRMLDLDLSSTCVGDVE
ncbi:thrombospondin type-1 domain-containing protein 1 [Salarias fasciatus]|uniref:thrombospondin type-1 domain-containing protein 1 n=1 Tax=Salarias fasciatus TaxID=181472 RepID=UPI0011770D38|nr:thrombospondin type-1 domain-containing protein 1 [Salarias fasciatus]